MAVPNNSVTMKTEEFLLQNENIPFGLQSIPHYLKHLITNVDRDIPGKRKPKITQYFKLSPEMDYLQMTRVLIETIGRFIGLIS